MALVPSVGREPFCWGWCPPLPSGVVVVRVIAAAAGVCLLWGSGWLLIKLGVTSFPPFLFAGVRGVAAAALLLAFAAWRKLKWPPSGELARMFGIGLLMTGVSNGLVYWAGQYIPSAMSALLFTGMPFFTAAFAHVLLPGERVNFWRLVGLLIGLGGVWLVLSERLVEASSGSLAGELAVVLSAVVWAFCLVLNKKLLRGVYGTVMTGVQLLSGSAVLLVAGLLVESFGSIQITPLSVSVFISMVLGQGCLAYFLYYWLMAEIGPTALSLTSFVTPTIAVVLGVALLSEPAGWRMVAGLATVGVGIFVVNVLGQRGVVRR